MRDPTLTLTTTLTIALLVSLAVACERPAVEPSPAPHAASTSTEAAAPGDAPASAPASAPSAHDHTNHKDLPANPPMSGHSVYQLTSSWDDQRDERVKLETFKGDIVVLALVYTHCTFACPRIIGDMRKIAQSLETTDGISFVLVSIDPERDTTARLAEFGEQTGLTAQGWTLLRGTDDDVRELAAVFGVQYRKTSKSDYAHSNVISVLDAKGEIVHQQMGLGVDPEATVKKIGEVRGESEGRAAK